MALEYDGKQIKVIAVRGAPTKYQSTFLLEAVGQESDGSFLPIDELDAVHQLEKLASETGRLSYREAANLLKRFRQKE